MIVRNITLWADESSDSIYLSNDNKLRMKLGHYIDGFIGDLKQIYGCLLKFLLFRLVDEMVIMIYDKTQATDGPLLNYPKRE